MRFGRSCRAEIGFDLLPGNRRLTSCLHLGTCRCCGPDVSHVLGKLEDLIEVICVDDRCYATATAGEVDRRVLGLPSAESA